MTFWKNQRNDELKFSFIITCIISGDKKIDSEVKRQQLILTKYERNKKAAWNS